MLGHVGLFCGVCVCAVCSISGISAMAAVWVMFKKPRRRSFNFEEFRKAQSARLRAFADVHLHHALSSS